MIKAIAIPNITGMRKVIAVGSTAVKRDYGIIAHYPKNATEKIMNSGIPGDKFTRTRMSVIVGGEESYIGGHGLPGIIGKGEESYIGGHEPRITNGPTWGYGNPPGSTNPGKSPLNKGTEEYIRNGEETYAYTLAV